MFCLNSGDNEVFPMTKRRQTIMKYKVGDKVRVRNGLVEFKEYGSHTFVPYMNNFKGEQIIKEVRSNGYTIEADTQNFKWTDEMFENIESEEQMDNQNITVNMENLSEEERSTLLSLVKKSNKLKSKVWKPEYGETYFYIGSRVYISRWLDDDIDRTRYAIGNCFKTQEEAEFALERQKVITELKRFALEHNEEIDGNNKQQNKYILFYNLCGNSIEIDYWRSCRYYGICFTSKEIAWQAVEKIGKERLKKYYFEVKE